VLLGMAAAKRGTLDATTSKMLFLHVPARHPATYPELELSPLVQAAALLGVGLLYQGSCHRRAARRVPGRRSLRSNCACAQAGSSLRPLAAGRSNMLRRRPALARQARARRAQSARGGPRCRPTRARARARRLTTEIMIEEIGRRPGGGGGGGGADGDGGAPRNNADAAGATGAVAQVIFM
jgi:hypothetical protein